MTSKGKAQISTKLNREAKTILLDTFELTDSASRHIFPPTALAIGGSR